MVVEHHVLTAGKFPEVPLRYLEVSRSIPLLTYQNMLAAIQHFLKEIWINMNVLIPSVPQTLTI